MLENSSNAQEEMSPEQNCETTALPSTHPDKSIYSAPHLLQPMQTTLKHTNLNEIYAINLMWLDTISNSSDIAPISMSNQIQNKGVSQQIQHLLSHCQSQFMYNPQVLSSNEGE
ncbi:hypothetical protein G9A89_001890 [Geosiphon pyriformis]|nr:hypothetical protein G9A89_001890 [Geosiphon pyriformis]